MEVHWVDQMAGARASKILKLNTNKSMSGTNLEVQEKVGKKRNLPEGWYDGIDDTVGYDEGLSEGAALCGTAPATTKSDAVAAATTMTLATAAGLAFSGGTLSSKLITAIPLMSNKPGATSEGKIT
jgi:hypothetical protein